MASVHPTAILEGEVVLADDAAIGPHCVLDASLGPIRIGAGTTLKGHDYLHGPLTMGARNQLWPFVCLGFAPQSLRYDVNKPGHGLVIGEGNRFREHVTIHRAMTDEGPTRIGDRNFFMAGSHAGHDCQVASDCVFANVTLLAGHVHVEDRVITGGNATVHQFVRLGHGAFISGSTGAAHDVPPWFTQTGTNFIGSINIVGLRRSGAGSEAIEQVKWVFKTLYRRGLSPVRALETLRERAGEAMIDQYIRFIEVSKRGLTPGRVQRLRGAG
jgi:UDP-N-acetylglucosamine acyltransferase